MDPNSKYEEALERAKELHEAGNALTKSQMEIVFPELKESEDERIRKALVNFFKNTHDWANLKYDGNEIVAYLERQKEQKPIISEDAIREGVAHFGITQYQINNWLKKHINIVEQQPAEWSEEDESRLDDVEKAISNYYDLNHAPQYCYWLEQKLNSLCPQPHWKPSEEQMRCLLDCVSKAKEIHNASTGGYDAYHTLSSLYLDLKKLL